MSDANLALVRRLYERCEALDFEAVYALLHPDLVYQNMAQQPIHGADAIREIMKGFAGFTALRFDMINMVAAGDVVMTEHLDHWSIDGREIELPMATSFTIRGARIAAWREYYDMATLERQWGRDHPRNAMA